MTIRTKLADLTQGTLYGFSAVKVVGSVRIIRIMVEDCQIVIDSDWCFEYLPAGMTYRAIADHALAVANGTPKIVGQVVRH